MKRKTKKQELTDIVNEMKRESSAHKPMTMEEKFTSGLIDKLVHHIITNKKT